MKFNRLKLLWQDAGAGKAAGLEEPSEARFRAWVLAIAAIVGPPLLFILYYKTMFPGLTNSDALDFAQLGRNLSSGHGFTTLILRPLALTHGTNPLHQPDVTHGPLYPLILAVAFAALGAKDSVAAWVSGLFYLLTIPVLYRLGMRMFGRGAALAATLIFTFNALLLEYAASGLDITLYIFLTTCLLLTVHTLAVRSREDGGKLPAGPLVMAGALTGLLYLTDPIFVWIMPVLAIAVFTLFPLKRVGAVLRFAVPLLVLTLPWMARNAMLTGNPVFGLRGMELWMNTKDHYPGLMGYRLAPHDMAPGVGLFKAVVQKVLLGAGQVIQAFPQVTASWVLAFLLPSLLFRFTDPATNTLRRVMMYCFFGLFVGMLAFEIQMPLFVSLIPTMLVFAVAYLLYLLQQAQLRRGATMAAAALIAVAVVFPLVSDMTLIDHPQRLKEIDTALALGKAAQRDDVVLSDQPWLVAWHADRPSLWIPAQDQTTKDLRQQFATTRWLFMTAQTQRLSPEWQQVYGIFRRWNEVYAQAREAKQQMPQALRIQGKGLALAEALDGFVSVEPVEKQSPTALIATLPTTDRKIGMR